MREQKFPHDFFNVGLGEITSHHFNQQQQQQQQQQQRPKKVKLQNLAEKVFLNMGNPTFFDHMATFSSVANECAKNLDVTPLSKIELCPSICHVLSTYGPLK